MRASVRKKLLTHIKINLMVVWTNVVLFNFSQPLILQAEAEEEEEEKGDAKDAKDEL